MADYNIYIHTMDGEAGGSNNGTPTFNPTTPWESDQQEENTSLSLMKETPSFIADAKKTTKFAKMSPWIAAAYAVIKLSYSITKTVAEFSAIETGDFTTTNAFHNLESSINASFHPISTTIQTMKTMKLAKLENQRREMQRQLLGDSEINRYTNRGY